VEIFDNTVEGRLHIKTNEDVGDYVNIAYATDIARTSRAWSFECALALGDQAHTALGIGVAEDATYKKFLETVGYATISVAGGPKNGVLFQRNAGGVINCITSSGGNDVTTVTTVTPTNNVFMAYGIEFNGVDAISFYLNDVEVARQTTSDPSTPLVIPVGPTRPILEVRNTQAASDNTYIDHIAFFQAM
jgi:hypothetical protein